LAIGSHVISLLQQHVDGSTRVPEASQQVASSSGSGLLS
jgi:hypothetical protein